MFGNISTTDKGYKYSGGFTENINGGFVNVLGTNETIKINDIKDIFTYENGEKVFLSSRQFDDNKRYFIVDANGNEVEIAHKFFSNYSYFVEDSSDQDISKDFFKAEDDKYIAYNDLTPPAFKENEYTHFNAKDGQIELNSIADKFVLNQDGEAKYFDANGLLFDKGNVFRYEADGTRENVSTCTLNIGTKMEPFVYNTTTSLLTGNSLKFMTSTPDDLLYAGSIVRVEVDKDTQKITVVRKTENDTEQEEVFSLNESGEHKIEGFDLDQSNGVLNINFINAKNIPLDQVEFDENNIPTIIHLDEVDYSVSATSNLEYVLPENFKSLTATQLYRTNDAGETVVNADFIQNSSTLEDLTDLRLKTSKEEQSLSAEINTNNQSILSLDAEREAFNKELEELNKFDPILAIDEEIGNLNRERAKIEVSLPDFDRVLASAREEYTAREEEFSKLSKLVARANQCRAILQDRNHPNFNEVNRIFNSLSKEIEKYDVKKMKEGLSRAKNIITSCEEKISLREGKVEYLKNQAKLLENSKANKDELAKRANPNQKRIEEVEAEIKSRQEKIDELRKNNETLEQKRLDIKEENSSKIINKVNKTVKDFRQNPYQTFVVDADNVRHNIVDTNPYALKSAEGEYTRDISYDYLTKMFNNQKASYKNGKAKVEPNEKLMKVGKFCIDTGGRILPFAFPLLILFGGPILVASGAFLAVGFTAKIAANLDAMRKSFVLNHTSVKTLQKHEEKSIEKYVNKELNTLASKYKQDIKYVEKNFAGKEREQKLRELKSNYVVNSKKVAGALLITLKDQHMDPAKVKGKEKKITSSQVLSLKQLNKEAKDFSKKTENKIDNFNAKFNDLKKSLKTSGLAQEEINKKLQDFVNRFGGYDAKMKYADQQIDAYKKTALKGKKTSSYQDDENYLKLLENKRNIAQTDGSSSQRLSAYKNSAEYALADKKTRADLLKKFLQTESENKKKHGIQNMQFAGNNKNERKYRNAVFFINQTAEGKEVKNDWSLNDNNLVDQYIQITASEKVVSSGKDAVTKLEEEIAKREESKRAIEENIKREEELKELEAQNKLKEEQEYERAKEGLKDFANLQGLEKIQESKAIDQNEAIELVNSNLDVAKKYYKTYCNLLPEEHAKAELFCENNPEFEKYIKERENQLTSDELMEKAKIVFYVNNKTANWKQENVNGKDKILKEENKEFEDKISSLDKEKLKNRTKELETALINVKTAREQNNKTTENETSSLDKGALGEQENFAENGGLSA